MKNNVLCTICMRDGSKGVKDKCIKKINDKHLFLYTAEIAKKLNFIDRIVVSTNSKKYKKLCEKYNLSVPFIRSEKLSRDISPKIPVVKDALLNSEKIFKQKFDIIIDLDVSSPLRIEEDVSKAFKKFIKNKLGILFSVCNSRKNPYFNMIELNNDYVSTVKKKKNFYRRQDTPKVYDVNASIYIWKRDYLINKKSLFSKKTGVYIMPEIRSMDIDSNDDFKIVEFLLKNGLSK
jgi:CMP-N,N'-diacetyllegionaminic acid synthase